MFQTWGKWLGIENGQRKEEDSEGNVGQNNQVGNDQEKGDQSAQPDQKDPGFGGYIYHLASSASKKLSESVAETAQNLKKSVEEGRINGIIDKTILGDFQKEQERFVQGKKAKDFSAAVPPWVGFNEEDSVQQLILALSADKRNFLRDPPAGVQFDFDFENMYPVAMVMLEEDELLRKMRFHLVPKQVKEEVFWKNYFYRVSLIKQSAQLTALSAQQAAESQKVEKTDSNPEESQQKEETPDWEKELQEELQEYDVLADSANRDDNWDREIEEMLMEDS